MRSHCKPKSSHNVLSQLKLSQALQGLHAEWPLTPSLFVLVVHSKSLATWSLQPDVSGIIRISDRGLPRNLCVYLCETNKYHIESQFCIFKSYFSTSLKDQRGRFDRNLRLRLKVLNVAVCPVRQLIPDFWDFQKAIQRENDDFRAPPNSNRHSALSTVTIRINSAST